MIPILPPGLTQEMVDESTVRNTEGINRHNFQDTLNRVAALIDLECDPREKRDHLKMYVAGLTSTLEKSAACSSGCHHCCKMSCIINSIEASEIGRHIGRTPKSLPQMIPDEHTRDKYVTKYVGVECPFLGPQNDQGQRFCTIYQVRPMSCRMHYNLSAYPDICNVIDYPGNPVPTLDMSIVYLTEVFMFGHMATYGDIRQYFPLEQDVNSVL